MNKVALTKLMQQKYPVCKLVNKSPRDRGQWAQKQVQEFLQALNDILQDYTWNRVYDSRSAGKLIPAQAGDFQAFRKTPEGPRNFVIEVKEVAHDVLLPHGNYDAGKVARVFTRTLAGSEAIVVIYHSTSGMWRIVPFEIFRTRVGGSWNLSGFPPGDFRPGLLHALGVTP